MTNRVVELGLLDANDFTLIDVGASGGLDPRWDAFGKNLRVFAFEPLLGECERLNHTIATNKIEVFPYFVGDGNTAPNTMSYLKGIEKQRVEGTEGFIARSSTLRAEIILGQKYRSADVASLGLTDKTTSLDDFASKKHIENVDFIKIDTDGSDFEVLIGAQNILSRFTVLGVTFEALLNPSLDVTPPSTLTLADYDRFCRDVGFCLYDLELHRYSRRHLPLSFVSTQNGGTVWGPACWADAYYGKDFCTDTGQDEARKISDAKLMKLACLFELMGLPDCAAELLEIFRARFDAFTRNRTEELENCLVPPLKGKRHSYKEYNQLFDSSLPKFYYGVLPQLSSLYESRSWKITAPLRAATTLLNRAVTIPSKIGGIVHGRIQSLISGARRTKAL